MKSLMATNGPGALAVCLVCLAALSLTGCPDTPPPTIEPPSAFFDFPCQPVTVVMGDLNHAAAIYVTTDGSTPTTGSTLYSGAFLVTPPSVVKAMAQAPGSNQSPVSSTSYTCVPTRPVFSPPRGVYKCPLNVSISDTTPGTSILFGSASISYGAVGISPGPTLVPPSTPFTSPIKLPPAMNLPLTLLSARAQLGGPPPAANDSGAFYQCASFDVLDITIGTGNDNAQDGTEIAAKVFFSAETGLSPLLICLKPSNSTSPDAACRNGPYAPFPCGSTWDNFTSCPLEFYPIAPPVPPGPHLTSLISASDFAAIEITLIQQDPGCSWNCDNWDLQSIMVIARDSDNVLSPVTLLNVSRAFDPNNKNNCLARLKAAPNPSSVIFPLDGSNPGGVFFPGGGSSACTPGNS